MVFFFDLWLINSIPQVLLTSIIVWSGLSKKAMTAPNFLTARDTNTCLDSSDLNGKANTDSINFVSPPLVQSQSSSSKSGIIHHSREQDEDIKEDIKPLEMSNHRLENFATLAASNHKPSNQFQSVHTQPSISINVTENPTAAAFSDGSESKYRSYSANASPVNNSRENYLYTECIN